MAEHRFDFDLDDLLRGDEGPDRRIETLEAILDAVAEGKVAVLKHADCKDFLVVMHSSQYRRPRLAPALLDAGLTLLLIGGLAFWCVFGFATAEWLTAWWART